MRRRTSCACIVAAIVISVASGSASCGARVPPATVPPTPRPELEPLRTALKDYLDKTQPLRRTTATQTASLPNQKGSSPQSAEAVRAREHDMAEAIRTQVRPGARQGDIFSVPMASIIRSDIAAAFQTPKADLIRDELREQTEGEAEAKVSPRVNETLKAPMLPPLLVSILPELPEQLVYDFTGRALVLRDIDANIVVDFVPDALPETPQQPAAPPPSGATAVGSPVLPVPDMNGTVFAAIGDSGSGDRAQYSVAEAMARYFESSRRFGFVIMLGDNLYHDDYEGEFLEPYKALLDRGVSFYAALGNHDRALEQHFKPFNMDDRLYYTFHKGNAHFVVLDSNRPTDRTQLEWLDTAFGDTGNDWRIAFFHHPLYSSGEHARQSRDSIRPALEPALVRNKVNVVFGGHEHLYERVAPQQGIRYFVSGGGGRSLYDVEASPFDEVAVSAHHFMVMELVGDEMFFEAVTPEGSLLDCGVIWRTPDAETKGPDAKTQAWLRDCRATLPRPPASRSAQAR
jgi:hypothetical protein